MTSRKLAALVLAFAAPWGTGHFHYGRRVRGVVWLCLPMISVGAFASFLPRLGHAMGWGPACTIPFIVMLAAWVASIVDLFVVREGPVVAWWHTALFALLGIAMPVMVAALVRVFVLEAFRVPSASMEPSILAGDHLFADKSDHRARYGDLVLFDFPDNPAQTFLKRVVARPGDALEMKRGRPWINGWEVPSCPLGKVSLGDASGQLALEFLGDASYLVFYDDASVTFEHAGPFYAAPNGVLVLGDNRNNSHDSRMFRSGLDGNVQTSALRGRAIFVWLRTSSSDDARFGIDLGIEASPALPSSLATTRPALDTCLATRPIARPPAPLAH